MKRIPCFFLEKIEPARYAEQPGAPHIKSPIYRRADTGEEITIYDAPVGAMWFYYDSVLMVKTPGGEWCIDTRASNCTLPDDTEHKCWIRHGTPPNITVDKNGKTCAAGAGSIKIGNYHGFLRNGFLEEC